MKILLVRPPYVSLFSRIKLVNVEPLELEILLTVASKDGHDCLIYDGVVQMNKFASVLKEFNPDFVAITGYVTQKNLIIKYTEIIKEYSDRIQVIVGGVHAELNYQDFFHPSVDFIVHSGGIRPFRELLNPGQKKPEQILGICYRRDQNNWICTEKILIDPNEAPITDRSFFYKHQDEFNYLHFRPCATVKTSYSCPHHCNFCYCCLINEGRYLCRGLEKVVEEIASIRCENIWIVDDTFYIDRQRIEDFVRLIKESGIRKNFIVYYRADFIAENEEMIVLLKSVGLKMVLVGLEAFDDQILEGYNKNTSFAINERCLSLLRKHDIGCTGLFVLDIDGEREDFTKLSRYIKKHQLNFSTASILTPLPGTLQYEKFKDRMITDNPKHWDFLHLVANPGKMSSSRFYFEFFRFYLQIFFMNRPLKSFKEIYLKYISHLAKDYLQGLLGRKS